MRALATGVTEAIAGSEVMGTTAGLGATATGASALGGAGFGTLRARVCHAKKATPATAKNPTSAIARHGHRTRGVSGWVTVGEALRCM
jgi:hypothetical protein